MSSSEEHPHSENVGEGAEDNRMVEDERGDSSNTEEVVWSSGMVKCTLTCLRLRCNVARRVVIFDTICVGVWVCESKKNRRRNECTKTIHQLVAASSNWDRSPKLESIEVSLRSIGGA